MRKFRYKVKADNSYLAQYKAIRKIATFNFELDLRTTKDDSELNRSQRTQITKAFNQYTLIEHTKKMRLYKPRKQRGESEAKYKKRFKEIQKKRGGSYSHLNIIPVQAQKGDRIKLEKDGTINVFEKLEENKKVGIQKYNYSTKGRELEILEDLGKFIKGIVSEHSEKHTNRPATHISASFNNYMWEKMGLPEIELFITDLQNVLNEYVSDGADSVNTIDFLTEITMISDPNFY